MSFHNAIKAALKADEIRRHLPEVYPEFYYIFHDVISPDGGVPSIPQTALTGEAGYGSVPPSMSTRYRRWKRAEMKQKGKRVLGELMRQFAELTTEQRKGHAQRAFADYGESR